MNHFLSVYSIYTNFLWRAFLLVSLLCPDKSFAQQSPTYYRISYYKVVPGNEEKLSGMMREVDAKVQLARTNSRAISGWYFYKLLSPAGSSTDYDYMAVTIINRYKDIFEPPYTFDSALKKTFPKNMQNSSATTIYDRMAS